MSKVVVWRLKRIESFEMSIKSDLFEQLSFSNVSLNDRFDALKNLLITLEKNSALSSENTRLIIDKWTNQEFTPEEIFVRMCQYGHPVHLLDRVRKAHSEWSSYKLLHSLIKLETRAGFDVLADSVIDPKETLHHVEYLELLREAIPESNAFYWVQRQLRRLTSRKASRPKYLEETPRFKCSEYANLSELLDKLPEESQQQFSEQISENQQRELADFLGQMGDSEISSPDYDQWEGPANARQDRCLGATTEKNFECRMLTCICIPDTDEEPFSSNLEWFDKRCEICHAHIEAFSHALRLPSFDGGWYGCVCSFDCLKDLYDLNPETSMTLEELEVLIIKSGIWDRSLIEPSQLETLG